MKKIIGIFMCAVLILSMTGILSSVYAAADSVPGIIYVPWKLGGGEIGVVYGGYFGDYTKAVVAVQPLGGYSGELNPDSAKYQLKPFNGTDRFVQFLIPSGIENDVWAVWVKNQNGWSDVRYVNKAQIFWVNEHEIYSGQKLLLNGRNIPNPSKNSADGVRVEFVEEGSGKLLYGAVTDITEYSVSFSAPDNLTLGSSYKIRYTNGAGGEYGWADMNNDEREKVTVVEYNKNTKYFDDKYELNISWFKNVKTDNIANVKDFGAMGDGKTNDTAAIQRAADKVRDDGGGMVYLPKGTYIIDIIHLGENTVIEGESRKESILKWSGADTRDTSRWTIRRSAVKPDNEIGYGEANKMIYSIASNVGALNFSMISDVERPKWAIDNQKRLIYGWVVPIAFFGGWNEWNDEQLAPWETSTNAEGYVVKNVDMKVVDGSCVDEWAPRHVVIEDNNFDITHYGPEIRCTAYARIRNNVIKNVCRPLVSWMRSQHGNVEHKPDRNWFEGNTLIGDSIVRKIQSGEIPDPGWACLHGATEHRGTDFSGDEYLFVNNVFEGTLGDHSDNSGEGFQGQTGICRIVAPVSEAEDNSVTSGYPLEGKTILADYDYVVITDGPGLGQARLVKEVKGDTIIVDKPWDVIPTNDSAFTVNPYIQARITFSNNQFNANNNKGGYHFYRCGFDSVLTDNSASDGGGIWMAAIMNLSRLDIQYFMHVENNDLNGSSNHGHGRQGGASAIGPGMDGGIGTFYEQEPPEEILSTLMYGVRILHNRLIGTGTTAFDKAGAHLDIARDEKSIVDFSSNSGIVSSTGRHGIFHEATLSEIIDGNVVKNTVAGIHLSGNSSSTVIRNNDLSGNGKEINEVTPAINTIFLDGSDGKAAGIYEKTAINKAMLKGTSKKGNDGFIYGDFSEASDIEEALFADVVSHWGRLEIEKMAKLGVITGDSDVYFSPDRNVSRVEFFAMLTRALGIVEIDYLGAYYDVFTADWYAKIMQAVKVNSLMPEEMLTYNKAFPNKALTREEAAVIILKACQLQSGQSDMKLSLEVYDDNNEISIWAEEGVKNAYALNIMRGVENHSFLPEGTLTRAEAAAVISRLLDVLK